MQNIAQCTEKHYGDAVDRPDVHGLSSPENEGNCFLYSTLQEVWDLIQRFFCFMEFPDANAILIWRRLFDVWAST